jgi:2-polyprenyl-3-methyl-5-hydroxy-6-metoxy-1,4-benzoquinol methylase
MNNLNKIKKTESETLKTFKEEVPSIYFSATDDAGYKKFSRNFEKTYRDLFNFPSKMFLNTNLIDFGAGTGHHTICLANWGAKCTLVELSDKSLGIAKELFSKRATNPNEHRFVNSSIFDFNETDKFYDIVHCRGVLSHTAANEQAFKKICKLVKSGGYLIFGDPNKAGGFQNMLQRYALYKFSNTDEDIVKNSEILFKNDIDRSQEAVPRTRKEIIYDRWVIQSQDDPSFSEVCRWLFDCKLSLYSTYPTSPHFFLSDSCHNKNKVSFDKIKNIPILSEILWMMKTQDDKDFLNFLESDLEELNANFSNYISYLSNCNKETKINTKDFSYMSEKMLESIDKIKFIEQLKNKLTNFILESKKLINLVNSTNIDEVKNFVEKCSILFKGPSGIRHVDFIAYKED